MDINLFYGYKILYKVQVFLYEYRYDYFLGNKFGF